MVYVNSAARQGLTRDSAPLFTPRQIDDARQAAAHALGEAPPRDRQTALPPDHLHGPGLSSRPRPRRLSRPDRPARRSLLGAYAAHR